MPLVCVHNDARRAVDDDYRHVTAARLVTALFGGGTGALLGPALQLGYEVGGGDLTFRKTP